MKIIFNRQEVESGETSTLKEFLVQHGYTNGHYSVAVNQVFVLRAHYETTRLNPLDNIDIIKPMQGG